jgi:predicted pyridoxine 5'-phosphate oxidase superfamily flavin-nucleotide-binding protein
MGKRNFYHDGSRALQDEFDTRRLADRLEETRAHERFSDADRAFIEGARMFFLATSDAAGHPECSYKGGDPGFVKVVGPRELAFPSYDGNGMYLSLGNIAVNPHVAMLFIDFDRPGRIRVNGDARLSREDPLLAEYPEAQLVVRVEAHRIFPNCPRYIHRMELVEPSAYVPRPGQRPPRPKWKDLEDLRDYLPERDRRDRDEEE